MLLTLREYSDVKPPDRYLGKGADMRGRTLLAVITVLTFACNAAAQDRLRFSAIDAPALTPVAERIVSRAYAELGIEVETVVSTPGGR
jgi:polar amino acid transport system substrate-binding protein